MLLNTISLSSEKIIWDFFHQMNNYEKNIKKIFDSLIYNNDYMYDQKIEKYTINFLDFYDVYSKNNISDTYNLKIFYGKIKIIEIYKKDKFFIFKDENNIISNDYIENFNLNIKEIIRLESSNFFYILL